MSCLCITCGLAFSYAVGERGRERLRCGPCTKKRATELHRQYRARLRLTPEGIAKLRLRERGKYERKKARQPVVERPTPKTKLLAFECVRCKKLKPRGLFPSRGRGQFKYHCKECEAPSKSARAHLRLERSKGRGKFTAADVRQLHAVQGGRCASCGVDFRLTVTRRCLTGYHIDHIISIAKGGMNTPDNLQLLCPGCNLRKSSK